jgi:hypothetical protein
MAMKPQHRIQNWPKYAAADKNECIGMVTTGGPASYVELLSCVEILRDARNIGQYRCTRERCQVCARRSRPSSSNTSKAYKNTSGAP